MSSRGRTRPAEGSRIAGTGTPAAGRHAIGGGRGSPRARAARRIAWCDGRLAAERIDLAGRPSLRARTCSRCCCSSPSRRRRSSSASCCRVRRPWSSAVRWRRPTCSRSLPSCQARSPRRSSATRWATRSATAMAHGSRRHGSGRGSASLVGTRRRAFFDRHGGKAVFLGRSQAVLRALVPMLAGMSGLAYRTFLPWNALGGLLWGGGVVVLGYVFAHSLGSARAGPEVLDLRRRRPDRRGSRRPAPSTAVAGEGQGLWCRRRAGRAAVTVEIRASTVLPARREPLTLVTSDGLRLVGELALRSTATRSPPWSACTRCPRTAG